MWLGVATGTGAVDGAGSRVLVTTIDDVITPVIADHLGDGVERAARGGYQAYVVQLDTPGGLDVSMRHIIQDFLDAGVPVVVYVSPPGARAASAGALITFSAHVAAMAPGTAIGAATPVDLEGGDLGDKAVNDAAALAESVARLRGRNVEFAVDTVRQARSAPVDEALELGAIDVVAASLPELLEGIDGTEVTLAGGEMVTLATDDAAVERFDIGFFRQVLQWLADPNLAFLFLSVGTLGLIYELASPGVGAGGVVGASLIILAMFSLSVLPVDAVGLLFLLLAAALLVAELFVPGVGVFATLGAVALVLSGLFLFRGTAGLEVSLLVTLPTALLVGGGTVVAGRLALRARRAPSTTTGKGALVGRVVTVQRSEGSTGQAHVDGTWWNLRSTGPPLEPGDQLRVRSVDGLDLVVEPTVAEPNDMSDKQEGADDG
jgi:membrane-bound serine protease (ClpP class)